jgi:hypothetical protein
MCPSSSDSSHSSASAAARDQRNRGDMRVRARREDAKGAAGGGVHGGREARGAKQPPRTGLAGMLTTLDVGVHGVMKLVEAQACRRPGRSGRGSVAWAHPARARSLGRGVISLAGCGSILPARGRWPGLIVLSGVESAHGDLPGRGAVAGFHRRRRAEARPPRPARDGRISQSSMRRSSSTWACTRRLA